MASASGKVESMFSSRKFGCWWVSSLLLVMSLSGCRQSASSSPENDAKSHDQAADSSSVSSQDQVEGSEAPQDNLDSTKENRLPAEETSSQSVADAHQQIRQWLTQLVGEDTDARNLARQQLDEQSIEDKVFVTLIKDSVVAVRHGTLYYLTGRFVIQDMALQQAFLDALRDDDPKVRELALQMVSRLPAETIRPAIPQLVRMLHSDREAEANRTRTALFLGGLNMEWEQVLPALTASVKTDPADAVRKASLFGVSRVALPAEAVSVYRHVLLHEENPAVKRTAVAHLGKLGQRASAACGELGLALQAEDEQLSDAAAQALKRIGAKAVPELIRQVSSSVPRARRLAIFSLGALGPQAQSAIPTLKQCLQDDDAEVRRLSEQALRQILFFR